MAQAAINPATATSQLSNTMSSDEKELEKSVDSFVMRSMAFFNEGPPESFHRFSNIISACNGNPTLDTIDELAPLFSSRLDLLQDVIQFFPANMRQAAANRVALKFGQQAPRTDTAASATPGSTEAARVSPSSSSSSCSSSSSSSSQTQPNPYQNHAPTAPPAPASALAQISAFAPVQGAVPVTPLVPVPTTAGGTSGATTQAVQTVPVSVGTGTAASSSLATGKKGTAGQKSQKRKRESGKKYAKDAKEGGHKSSRTPVCLLLLLVLPRTVPYRSLLQIYRPQI